MRSLRSVDDIVAAFHAAVSAAGQLGRTYFFFTADHGLHMGQFCLGPCKRQPYDTDLRIPTLAVGPGIKPGPLAIPAGIPDLAPTFLDLCGAKDAIAELHMDGRSLMPLLRGTARPAAPGDAPVSWREAHLVEYLATSGVFTGCTLPACSLAARLSLPCGASQPSAARTSRTTATTPSSACAS